MHFTVVGCNTSGRIAAPGLACVRSAHMDGRHMRSRWSRGTTTVAAITSMVFGLCLITAGSAEAATHAFPYPILRFAPGSQQVRLVIPTPACPASHPGCEWELYVNEPNAPGQPAVGLVSGRSGVLTVAYPDYCGVIQADAIRV